MYSTGHIDKKEMSDQPKPTTGEWMVSPIGQILHNGKVMVTAFNYAQGKACVDAINAALAEDQERVKKLADEWWGMALAAERERATYWELRCRETREQLEQAEAQDKRHMEKAHKEVMLERRQLAEAQAKMKAARELVQNDVAKDFFVKHGQRFVPSILNLLEGDTDAHDAATKQAYEQIIAAARQPLVDAMTNLIKSVEALEGQEIQYTLGMQLANDCKSAKAALSKLKEGK